MKRRVKVTFLPKAGKGMDTRSSGLEVRMKPGLGFNATQLNWPVMAGEFSKPDTAVNKTLKPVAREDANLEAEVGETALTDLNGDGISEHYKIGGKRHSAGGTPLYLPDNSFIFSRDRSMKIKDSTVLAQFGMATKKGGYTPADIAKKYDINKFRKILGDPDTDDLQRKSAESMVANYNLKLAKLALAQESIKGFPNGIPSVAMPYMDKSKIDPKSLIQAEQPDNQSENPEEDQTETQPEQAKYGMNVIAQLQKRKQGGVFNKRRVKVSYPKFQDGSQTGPKTVTTATTVVPTSATKFDTEDQVYATPNYKDLVESGNAYIKADDGKYHRITYMPAKPDAVDLDVNNPEVKLLGNQARKYAYFKAELKNPEVQKAIIEQYKANLNTVKNPTLKATLSKKSPDEIIADFAAMQKQNFVFAANADKIDITTSDWLNNSPTLNKTYSDAATKLGLTPLTKEQTASGQLGFIAFAKASKDDKTKNTFQGITPNVRGTEDEKASKDYTTSDQISPADGVVGNTTIGQMANASGVLWDDKEPALPSADVKAEHLVTPKYTGDANFWAQDIIGTAGAAADMGRIKKYPPWQATPQVTVADPTFYDPTRELAASQESAGMLTNGLAAFTGPQALSSRASSIQGQAAKDAANILGKYANLNVGVANQFELQNTSILNQAAQQRASLATGLFDKNTIANQEFDNSKAKARQVLRQSYVNALTNRANTYNLNSLYPQYAVDPLSAGMIDFTHGAGIKPEQPSHEDVGTIYQKLYDQYPTMRSNPGLIWKTAEKMAGVATPDDPDTEMPKPQSYPQVAETGPPTTATT